MTVITIPDDRVHGGLCQICSLTATAMSGQDGYAGTVVDCLCHQQACVCQGRIC